MVWTPGFLKLVEQFPHHFFGVDDAKSHFRARDGIAVCPGWSGIVRKLCAATDRHDGLPSDVRISKLREKFGGLRVSLTTVDGRSISSEHLAAVLAAEAESVKICEGCGVESSVRSEGGWLTTRCSECLLIESGVRGLFDAQDDHQVILPIVSTGNLMLRGSGWLPVIRDCIRVLRRQRLGRRTLNLEDCGTHLAGSISKTAGDVRGDEIKLVAHATRRICRHCGWPVDFIRRSESDTARCNACILHDC